MSLVFSSEIRLDTYVDGEWSADLSDRCGFGDTVTVTAPSIVSKTFSHWEANGSIVSYANPLKLTMNAHTTLYAVYASTAPTAKPTAGFTSITRTDDGTQISFQAMADPNGGTVEGAGIVYSTTAAGEDLIIGGTGVTDVAAVKLTASTGSMPASVLDKNNCWMLQFTPESADTVYHARAYVTSGGSTTYGDVKDVKLSELSSGISMIANLDGFASEPAGGISNNLENLNINISAAAVTKAPTAKTLSYNGSAQALVTAGTAAGGEMQYVLGTDAATAPAGDWSTTIPTGTEIGTYYVWYKVKGVANHSDTEAKALTVTISAPAPSGGGGAGGDSGQNDPTPTPSPTTGEITSTSVTVNATSGMEYSIDGGKNWVSAKTGETTVTFTGLTPGTEYELSARAVGTTSPVTTMKVTTKTTAGPFHIHTWGEWTLTKEATCAAKGQETRTCSGCDKAETRDIDVNPNNHTGKTEVKGKKKATTTAKGYTGDTYCKDCGKKLKSGKAIPKLTPETVSYKDLSKAEKQSADAVSKALGVNKDTAAKMVTETKRLGVSMDTVKLSGSALAKANVDSSDPKGSSFGALSARAVKRTKNALTLQWRKQKNADGYLIYGNLCGKGKKLKLVKTITKNGTVRFTQKKLKKGKYYKYMVVAYKNVNGEKMPIAASVVVHTNTKGGKVTVAKSLKVTDSKKKAVTKVTVKKGKTFQLKVTENKEDKKLKIKSHRKVKFESSNKKIATVNNSGKVTGKKKGSCTVWAYAQNGIFKAVKVTVK